ncbi:MAG: 50S ribosomal protein L25/general stress protein Ctc [Woeseia sp.]|nr:50S ribosomal protein L25/general stress protein Ctc [Woeseia sp.]MBT8098008.1 50S ribosomal protein L25/general stress protein Ctc [Woeseia sp.]NNE60784.1 50S ribosomal protein L25/general stress protein Ctc [Woeseia sp.]
MSQDFDLIAEFRQDQGKGASRRLRLQSKVPAIIYGGGREPRALAFDHNKLLRQMDSESFYSSVLNIKVGDTSQAAIVKDVQRHPAKRQVLHIDLQRIVEDQEIRMNVPLHFMGEEQAPGIKAGGSVSRLMTEVEVTCLPRFLPEYLEVDISAMELDDMKHLSDLTVPEGVEIAELAQGEGHDQPIVAIHVIKVAPIEEEVEAEEEASAEVPTVGDEKEADKEEGEKDD